MDAKSVFASNLNKYMKLRGKTRTDISNDLKISYFTVTAWTNASKYPRMDKVEMLANYLGIQKSDLIEEKSPSNDGLSEGRKALIDFAMTVPEDKAAMILQVMKTILAEH